MLERRKRYRPANSERASRTNGRCRRLTTIRFLLSQRIFVVMSLIATIAVAQGADEAQLDQNVQKLIATQRAWGTRMNSASATLELKEISRGMSNGHTVVRYRMLTSGLPTDKFYSVILWQLGGQPQTNLSGVTLDETGTAICAGGPGSCGGTKPNDPIDLVMMAGLGETKRLGLVASDQTARAFASVVPFPNRATEAGCNLEATLVTPNAEAMMLSGSGFKPGARLDVEIISEGEKQHPAATANENGIYEGVVLPFKKGLTKGRTQVSVRSGNCNPSVSFPWGADSYALQ